MEILCKRLLAAAVAMAALLTVAGTGRAGVVSIGLNFTGGNGGPFKLDATPPGLPAGVVSQNNWNDLAGYSQSSPSAAFQDNTGAATTATATWSGTDLWGTYGSSQSNANLQLLNGYVDTHHQTSTAAIVTVSNIPFATYEVIAYVNSDHLNTASDRAFGNVALSGASGGNATFYYTAVGPVSYTSAQLLAGDEFIQATATSDVGTNNPLADYAIFTGVTGSSFTLTNSAEGAVGSGNNTGLTGLQIVDTAAVPEPSTAALAAIGLLGLILIRRGQETT